MDELIEITPYSLYQILIDGVEVNARPIAWSSEMVDGEGHDSAGNLVVPTEYETACPHCGQMVHFSAGLSGVKCAECGRGQNIGVTPIMPVVPLSPFQEPDEYVPIPVVTPTPVQTQSAKEIDINELLGEIANDPGPDQ